MIDISKKVTELLEVAARDNISSDKLNYLFHILEERIDSGIDVKIQRTEKEQAESNSKLQYFKSTIAELDLKFKKNDMPKEEDETKYQTLINEISDWYLSYLVVTSKEEEFYEELDL